MSDELAFDELGFLPGDPRAPGLVATESEAFQAFDRWMEDQLVLLVLEWSHAARPSARRTLRPRFTNKI
jgi:hypothetical protein